MHCPKLSLNPRSVSTARRRMSIKHMNSAERRGRRMSTSMIRFSGRSSSFSEADSSQEETSIGFEGLKGASSSLSRLNCTRWIALIYRREIVRILEHQDYLDTNVMKSNIPALSKASLLNSPILHVRHLIAARNIVRSVPWGASIGIRS